MTRYASDMRSAPVGDFNNDGRDDVVAFVRNSQEGVGQGDAWVALSTGVGFAPAREVGVTGSASGNRSVPSGISTPMVIMT